MKKIIVCALGIIGLHFALKSINQSERASDSLIPKNALITLINKLNKENQKVSVMLAHPLLPGKVRLWQQKGILSFPTKQITWSTFINDIHQFGAFLASLLARNPQTGAYFHLEKLQKNRSLYTTLQNMEKQLKTYILPIQKETPFKLNKESLVQLQKIISLYITQLYKNKLLAQIKKLMEPFEKEAKKIRTKQEAIARKAEGKEFDFQAYDIEDYESDSEYDDIQDFGAAQEPSLDFDFDLDDDDFVSSFFE